MQNVGKKQTFDILTFTVFMTTITVPLFWFPGVHSSSSIFPSQSLSTPSPVTVGVGTQTYGGKTSVFLSFFPIRLNVMISSRDHRVAVSIVKCNSKEQTTYCIDFGHSHPSGKSVGFSGGSAV